MWTSFAAVTGGAGSGLAGLTFIVVSFRYDVIAVSDELRSRAAQTLLLFFTVLVASALITVPQNPRALGVELMAIALLTAVLLTSLDAVARRTQTIRPSPYLLGALAAVVLLILIAGLALLAGASWGMYCYVAGAVIALSWGAFGAWTFLTRAGTSSNQTQSQTNT